MRGQKWISPIVDFNIRRGICRYRRFIRDWRAYSRMPGAESLQFRDGYPCLYDHTTTNPFDSHYFYQDLWAYKQIERLRPSQHVDVGSNVVFVGFLTTITQVTYVDIRALSVTLDHFESRQGDVLAMPYDDNSVISLSCLHVAEHIGLGRYGDPLDPKGTQKATAELARVLSPGGNLYFSLPIGRPRICFNAHRIHSPQQILHYFRDLVWTQFSAIDDDGNFLEEADPADFERAYYACGLFHFTKK